MSEFYGEKVESGATDPRLDPLLTVRMQPPDTQSRRLDLTTPRVIRREGGAPWLLVTGEDGRGPIRGRTHADVADWPVQHPISYGAAQRLAQGPQEPSTGRAPDLPSDEDERPFR